MLWLNRPLPICMQECTKTRKEILSHTLNMECLTMIQESTILELEPVWFDLQRIGVRELLPKPIR
jgi:hypothetical protein